MPRTSNFGEEMMKMGKKKMATGRSMSGELFNGRLPPSYPSPNPMFSIPRRQEIGGNNNGSGNPSKEQHMFVWSSSASPVSEANMRNVVNKAASADFSSINASPSRGAVLSWAQRGLEYLLDKAQPHIIHRDIYFLTMALLIKHLIWQLAFIQPVFLGLSVIMPRICDDWGSKFKE